MLIQAKVEIKVVEFQNTEKKQNEKKVVELLKVVDVWRNDKL